jgi:exosome complex component RRP4
LPGEFLEEREGRKLGKHVYTEEGKTFSKVIGIPKIGENLIEVVPLAGKYIPKIGDRVIGIVSEVEISGWSIDINSPYPAFLPLSLGVEEFVDLTKTDIARYFDINDIIFCRIAKVSKDKIVQVTMRDPYARKLIGGILFKITPSKVARVIGKGGSMINLLMQKTKCEIIPGQNGLIWIKGKNKARVIEALLTIEKESHFIGLTEKIGKMLSEENEEG